MDDAVTGPIIGVCMKWVALRPDVDAVAATVMSDDRFAGASASDRAALEWALRLAERREATVTVVSVGPVGAEQLLREALACGAQRGVRVDTGLPADRQPTSRAVATALAEVLRGAALVLCGDWSLDRGSASVPAFLAGELGIGQACGLVALDEDEALVIHAERRLDGGYRQRLRIDGPAVLSVEGVVARLRRAPLSSVLAAQRATVEVEHQSLPQHDDGVRLVHTSAFRPPAHVLMGPDPSASVRSRVEQLTGSMSERVPPQKLVLDPEDAADRIIEQLRAWGELE